MTNFVHLHTHSHYSIFNGVSKIPQIIAKVKSLGQSAVALTDDGNMFGAMEFYREASTAGVKPIFGEEFYIAPTTRDDLNLKYYRLVLLAKNYTGYKNLLKLSSSAYTEGFYSKPRIDKKILREYSEGLIVLSGGVGGEIPQMILKHDDVGLKASLDWYIDTFGKENFFLEIQDHKLANERVVSKGILDIAKKNNLKIVATNNAHYIERDDVILQELMFCIRDKKTLSDPTHFRYDSNEFYLKSGDEMKALFSDVPEAITNTALVAEMCDIDFKPILEENHHPIYKLPMEHTADSYLKKLSYDGFNSRFKNNLSAEYSERLEYELDTIKQMGFSNYFLIVWEMVNFAQKVGISKGHGRGSTAGSLVAYCLGISNIDPIQYGLLFECFINPERMIIPDIDIDFEDARSDEVKEHICSHYGYNKTANAVTFGYLNSHVAIKEVARALDILTSKINKLIKVIDYNGTQESLADLSLNGSDEEKNWLNYSAQLIGTVRQIGTHASALIISEDILTDVVPLFKDMKTYNILTQFEAKYLEANGLLKIDILGLRTLDMIKNCLATINKNHNIEIDLDTIPLDDQNVYRLFCDGNTEGVFQFESDGLKACLKQLKPTCIEELIAINVLYRPGQMENIPSYIKRKHGTELIYYFHKNLEPILKSTYGHIIYKEQILQIGQTIAGFSFANADILRRAMVKNEQNKLDEMRAEWFAGAIGRGYTKEFADKIFNVLIPISKHVFSKSHSAGYSVLAYQTMYLKAYYPEAFAEVFSSFY